MIEEEQSVKVNSVSLLDYLNNRYPDRQKEIANIFESYESQLKLYSEREGGRHLKYKYFEDQNKNLTTNLPSAITNIPGVPSFNSQHHQSNQLASNQHGACSFPYFNQLHDQIREVIGPEQFLESIKNYVQAPEHTQKVKEELNRLEREVMNIEAKEEEKMLLCGLPILRDTLTFKHFEHSTLGNDIQEEFKNAKCIVLTTPAVSKQSGKANGNSQMKDSLISNTIQISNGNNGLGATLSNVSLQKPQSAINSLNQTSSQVGKIINPPPQKRYGHSATLVKNKMYIFGGLASQMKGGNFQTFYECQLKFNSDDGTLFNWEKIKSDAPKARDSHSCIHVGDSLILFGGSGGATSFNDLNRFDIKTQKWARLDAQGEIPVPREGHTAKAIGRDKMMIHGGVNQNEISFDDTYVLTGLSQLTESQQLSINNNFESKTVSPIQLTFEGLNNPTSYETNTSNTLSILNKQNNGQQGFNNNGKALNQLRWYKCIQRGDIPQGRDSHSSALINNKIYIFGGQGDNDIIFNDLYSAEIIEELKENGEIQFVAQWTRLEQQTPIELIHTVYKPTSRTSHTCTVYKNRYLIIIGGETVPSAQDQIKKQINQPPQTKLKSNLDISIDLEQECNVSEQENDSSQKQNEESPQVQENLKFLNDVWIYDTILFKWHEIKPHLKIQGPLAGKKIKKVFEPRMAHSAVQYDQFVIIFGGLNQERQPISNDLFILSLDGELGAIQKSLESGQESKQQIQIPEVNVLEKVQSAQGPGQKDKIKIARTLKITEPEDRREMSGQILNQIINFSSNQTNQYFLNGNQFYASSNPTQAFGLNGSNQQQKKDCQVQTCDNSKDLPSIQALEKQQIALIMRSNDFSMRIFQRTKLSFFKNLIRQIEWPLQCFGGFIDNSIQAFELQRYKQEQPRQMHHGSIQSMMNTYVSSNQKMHSITIEINMKNYRSQQLTNTTGYFGKDQYIEVKDNGPGIHPKQLMEVLTSFGSSNLLNIKSDYNFSEHGINLKICALRLANNALIITKTKPIVEYGSTSQYLSIALLSIKFVEDASSQFLVCPIIAFELKNKKIIKNLTPQPEHFLNKISHYTQPLFESGEKIQQYAMNGTGDCGTYIIMLDLCQQSFSKQDNHQEIGASSNDIKLNPKCFVNECQEDLIENSLRTYLKYLYVEQPESVRVILNGQQVDMQNPYSALKLKMPHVFTGDRQEKFAAQILNEDMLKQSYEQVKSEQITENQEDQIMEQTKEEDPNQWLKDLAQLQGILVYRGTGRLIRRIENVFGEDEDYRLQNSFKYEDIDGVQKKIFKKNGIISVFKSKSSTLIDKRDFSDKQIIKRMRQWMREKDAAQNVKDQIILNPQTLESALDYSIIKPDQDDIVKEQQEQNLEFKKDQ
eukprot:403348772